MSRKNTEYTEVQRALVYLFIQSRNDLVVIFCCKNLHYSFESANSLLRDKIFTLAKEDNILEIGLNRAIDLMITAAKKKRLVAGRGAVGLLRKHLKVK